MKHLFLDLEDTVITPVGMGWHNAELININTVRTWIASNKPDAVSIFSFAIHDQVQLAGFNEWVRPMLEGALGVRLSIVPTMDEDIIPACARAMRLLPATVTFLDAVEFWSKHQAFRLFVHQKFKGIKVDWGRHIDVTLFDDAALENEFWQWPELGINGEIIKV